MLGLSSKNPMETQKGTNKNNQVCKIEHNNHDNYDYRENENEEGNKYEIANCHQCQVAQPKIHQVGVRVAK